MARRSDEDRQALALWLQKNLERLSAPHYRTGALEEWRQARHLLWTAAAKLRAIEIGNADGHQG